MPLYEYECPGCWSQREDIRKIEDRDHGPTCDRADCRQQMKLILSPTPGIVKNPAVPRSSK